MTGSIYGLVPKGLDQALSAVPSGLGDASQAESGFSRHSARQQHQLSATTALRSSRKSQSSEPYLRQKTETDLLGGLSPINASRIARHPQSTERLSAVAGRLFDSVEGDDTLGTQQRTQESINTELNEMLPHLISSLQAMGYEGVESIRLGHDSKGQLEILQTAQDVNAKAATPDGEAKLEPHTQADEILNMLTHVGEAGQRLAKIVQPVSFLDIESGRLGLGEVGFASSRTAALGLNANFSS